MDFTQGQLKLLAYWGEIQSSVAQRASTANLWDAVKSASEAEGRPLRGVSAIDMNLLRSIASQQQQAMLNLQSARIDQSIDASMIARDVSARDLAAQALAPAWLVRFEQDLIVNGELTTVWRSSTFEPPFSASVSSLRTQLEQDAQQMLENSSGGIGPDVAQHAGIGRVQISAV